MLKVESAEIVLIVIGDVVIIEINCKWSEWNMVV